MYVVIKMDCHVVCCLLYLCEIFLSGYQKQEEKGMEKKKRGRKKNKKDDPDQKS